MRLTSGATWRDRRVISFGLAVTSSTLLFMGLFGEEPAVVDVAVAIVGGSLATLGVAAAMSDWPAAQAPWNGLCVFFAIESALTVGLWALVR